MHAAKVKQTNLGFAITTLMTNDIAGSRRGAPEPGGGSHGGACLPELYQDQHVFLGKNPEAELQAKEVPHQTAPGGLCKLTM